LAGFINADGHFGLYVYKNSESSIGERVIIKIQITQHNNSIIVLNHIIEFLKIGKIIKDPRHNVSSFVIISLADINKFINIFKETKLYGAKALDYIDFCKGIQIMNNKEHLNREGLNIIKLLSSNMNSNRTKFD